MPSLNSAITLVKVNVVAVCIAKDLHLNMARSLDVFLDKHSIVAETFHSLPFGSLDLVHELVLRVNDSHALAATSKHSFEHDRETNLLGLCKDVVRILVLAMVPLKHWHSGIYHDLLRFTLRTHLAYSAGRWPNKCQSFAFNQLHKICILRQETISIDWLVIGETLTLGGWP